MLHPVPNRTDVTLKLGLSYLVPTSFRALGMHFYLVAKERYTPDI